MVGYATGSSKTGVAVVEFTKTGEVTGWRAAENTKLISNVEYYYPQNKDDGTSLDADGIAGNLYGYGIHDSVLTSDSCAQDEKSDQTIYSHTHDNPSYSIYRNGTRWYARAYKDVLAVMKKGDAASTAATNIYQDGSAQVTVGGRLNLSRDTSSYNFNGGIDSQYNGGVTAQAFGGSATRLYKELKPVIYAKLTHPNLTYMGATATIKIQSLNAGINGGVAATYTVPAEASLVTGNDGSTWLRIAATQSQVVGIKQDGNAPNQLIQGITNLYAFPGATLGQGQIFSEVYIDEQFDEWESIYDGSKEADYVSMTVEDRVADSLDLAGTGDTTTPTLYHYDVDVKTTVLQKVLTGIRVLPGVGTDYALETREKEFYPNKQNALTSMVTISADNDDLTNYTTVLELPEKDKGVAGRFIGTDSGSGDVTATSEFTAALRSGVTVESNTTGITPTYRYRINGTWYTQEQMEANDNWDQVQAVEVSLSTLPKNTSITLGLKLAAEDKTNTDDLKGYLGGTFSYGSSGGSMNGTLTFATYVYHPYIISGNVFKDTDESGVKNGSEKGVKDITVALMSEDEEEPLATVQTDADGNYEIPTTEYRKLYLKITMPDDYKLTKDSEVDAADSDKDSDFTRETNLYEELPSRLSEGTYKIDAGIVKLPTLTAPDVTVRMEEPLTSQATVTWEKGTATIQYEEAADTSIATVAPTGSANAGTITPVKVGETTATAWVENSLGDRVEVTYNIKVIPREVAIELTKQLTKVADSDYTFVFKVEQLSDDEATVEKVFYQTIKIPQGTSSGVLTIKKLLPGKYRFTEVASNWRFDVEGTATQVVDAQDPDNASKVSYTNKKVTDQWSSANTSVTNSMNSVNP